MSISGGAVNTTFTYDANGNETAGYNRTLTWTSFNDVATIDRAGHDFGLVRL